MMQFGLIIIGDEILSGKRVDQHFAKVVGLQLGAAEDALDPYAQSLAAFREGKMERMGVCSQGAMSA